VRTGRCRKRALDQPQLPRERQVLEVSLVQRGDLGRQAPLREVVDEAPGLVGMRPGRKPMQVEEHYRRKPTAMITPFESLVTSSSPREPVRTPTGR